MPPPHREPEASPQLQVPQARHHLPQARHDLPQAGHHLPQAGQHLSVLLAPQADQVVHHPAQADGKPACLPV